MNSEKLSRLEKFFELNIPVMEYQEVIACTNKPLFNQKIFLKRALDPIKISLIEECFKVKILTTKVQKKKLAKNF